MFGIRQNKITILAKNHGFKSVLQLSVGPNTDGIKIANTKTSIISNKMATLMNFALNSERDTE